MSKGSAARIEAAEQVADLIIQQLDKDILPWRKPWTARGILPTSLTTGKPYAGVNVLVLALTQTANGWEHPLWLTYLEAQRRGGRIIKGSKSTLVVKYGHRVTTDKETGDKVIRPFFDSHRVFNIAQTTLEIPAEFINNREPVAAPAAIETILKSYANRPEIYHKDGDAAFYSPLTDSITLPSMNQFDTPEAYAATLCHELTHSTGHASRLDRHAKDGHGSFGSPAYAREELVADIGMNLLLSLHGVAIDIPNSASYIHGWMKAADFAAAIRKDSTLIIEAAGKAQRAVDYMMGVSRESDIDSREEVTA